jgi:hypothetical protein
MWLFEPAYGIVALYHNCGSYTPHRWPSRPEKLTSGCSEHTPFGYQFQKPNSLFFIVPELSSTLLKQPSVSNLHHVTFFIFRSVIILLKDHTCICTVFFPRSLDLSKCRPRYLLKNLALDLVPNRPVQQVKCEIFGLSDLRSLLYYVLSGCPSLPIWSLVLDPRFQKRRSWCESSSVFFLIQVSLTRHQSGCRRFPSYRYSGHGNAISSWRRSSQFSWDGFSN